MQKVNNIERVEDFTLVTHWIRISPAKVMFKMCKLTQRNQIELTQSQIEPGIGHLERHPLPEKSGKNGKNHSCSYFADKSK